MLHFYKYEDSEEVLREALKLANLDL